MQDLISLFSFIVKAKNTWMLMVLLVIASRAKGQNISFNDSISKSKSKTNPSRYISEINLSKVKFIKAYKNRINFGIVGTEYNYIILKLTSSKTYEGQYLSIDNTSLDTVSIFRIYNDGTSQILYEGGTLVQFKKNTNYVWHTVPVEISDHPTYYLIALKAAQKNINIQYKVLSRDDLQKIYQNHDRLVFFYIGVFV